MNPLPLFETRLSSATSTSGIDTALYAVFQDSSKKAISPKGPQKTPQISLLSSTVEKLRKGGVFDAKNGSLQFLRFMDLETPKGPSNSLLVGLGQASELTEEKMRLAGGKAWTKLLAEKVDSVVIEADLIHQLNWILAFAEGLMLSAYRFRKYKTQGARSSGDKNGNMEDSAGPSKILFATQNKTLKTELETGLKEVMAMGECVRLTRDWSNEPSNYGTPAYFANEAKKLAKLNGLKCKILNEADAAREKMGLFLGVGRGAERENQMVVLEYTPKGVKNPKTIALVGKGVTFDSGGISLKPSLKMEDMKHDMTGAATVMGALVLASKWKVSNRIVAVLAFCENMPDGNAIQPGNVLTSRNGKTVEVINTDAEGRLILADALDYAQDLKPDAIIDVATLTGAVSIALGKQCCGILGNDEGLIGAIRSSGDATGERIWELPLYDEYFEDLKSEIADMKNSANDSNGGTIRGAVFLKQFIKKGNLWAHLDIAATAWNLGHLSYCPKQGASGAYVRTLAHFIKNY